MRKLLSILVTLLGVTGTCLHSHAALVVHYTYDGTAGTASPNRVADGSVSPVDSSVGHIDDATLPVSGVTYQPGDSRGATGTHIQFSGASGAISFTNDSDTADATQDALKNAAGATFITGFRLDSHIVSGDPRIIYLSTGQNANSGRAELRVNNRLANGRYTFRAGGRSADADAFHSITSDEVDLELGRWYSVATVLDYAARTIRIYLDGGLIGSGSAGGWTGGRTSATDSIVALIGSNFGGMVLTGDLDDTRIYNHALSNDEIAAVSMQSSGPITFLDYGIDRVNHFFNATFTSKDIAKYSIMGSYDLETFDIALGTEIPGAAASWYTEVSVPFPPASRMFFQVKEDPAARMIPKSTLPADIPLQHPGYRVEYQGADGFWREAIPWAVRVNMDDVHVAAYSYIELTGTTKVRVRRPGAPSFGTVQIRPAALAPAMVRTGGQIEFTLTGATRLSIEFDGDDMQNLHILAGPPADTSVPAGWNVVEFGPGVHTSENHPAIVSTPLPDYPAVNMDCLHLQSHTVYRFARGAVIRGRVNGNGVSDVALVGPGVIDGLFMNSPTGKRDRGDGLADGHGFNVENSNRIRVDGLTIRNPSHYAFYFRNCDGIDIRNTAVFTGVRWGDGISFGFSKNAVVQNVIARTSDDTVVLNNEKAGTRPTYGITIKDATLWADVAHTIFMAIRGSQNAANPLALEDVTFTNIDILEHDEANSLYHGALAINCAEENIVRNILFDQIRVDRISNGRLLDIRVFQNPDYNPNPGREVSGITIRNLTYSGAALVGSQIAGWSSDRKVRNVLIENLTYRGQRVTRFQDAQITTGPYVENVQLR